MNFDCLTAIFERVIFIRHPMALSCKRLYALSAVYIQPLETAIETGDVLSVIRIDEWYSKIDYYDIGKLGSMMLLSAYEKHNTPDYCDLLRGACRGGHIDIVNYVLSFNITYDSALDIACECGHTEIVRILLEYQTYLSDAFYFACCGGHIDIINLLIERGECFWDIGLLGACVGGQFEIAELMISYGVNDLNNCLTAACRWKHTAIIKLLIKSGANECECGRPIHQH